MKGDKCHIVAQGFQGVKVFVTRIALKHDVQQTAAPSHSLSTIQTLLALKLRTSASFQAVAQSSVILTFLKSLSFPIIMCFSEVVP